MNYFHVDVFTSKALSGNGLTVVFPPKDISQNKMLRITQEFNQFETIFIFPKEGDYYPVRVFTVEEELDFAGHPLIGAAAVIHYIKMTAYEKVEVKFILGKRKVFATSSKEKTSYQIELNQGRAQFLNKVSPLECRAILKASNLTEQDVSLNYPLEVVSTGLSYLLMPLKDLKSLEKIKIRSEKLEEMLLEFKAKFVYFFETETLECRTWDNFGIVEDVATGSAAGPLCAYLVKNSYGTKNNKIAIKQGKYLGRPSIINSWVNDSDEVFIEGEVAFFAQGKIAE